MLQKWSKILANLAAVGLCIFFLLYFTGGGKVWNGDGWNDSNLIGDSSIYYNSAARMYSGVSPYNITSERMQKNAEHPGSVYCYLPVLATLLTPLTPLSIEYKMLLWYLVITLSFILSYWLLLRLALLLGVAPPSGWRFPALVGIVALLFEPIQNNYLYAQSNSLVLLSIVGFIYCYVTEKKIWAGGLLGFGIALKFFPLIFVPLLIIRKDWRILLFAFLAFMVFILLPVFYIDLNVLYSDFVTTIVARLRSSYQKCEFFMTLNRSVIWFFPALQSKIVQLLSASAVMLALLGFDFQVIRKSSSAVSRMRGTIWLFTAAAIAILFIHPHSEVHIVVFSSPAFILLAFQALNSFKVKQIALWLLIYVLYFPLLWVQETPVTFFALLLSFIYSLWCAAAVCRENAIE